MIPNQIKTLVFLNYWEMTMRNSIKTPYRHATKDSNQKIANRHNDLKSLLHSLSDKPPGIMSSRRHYNVIFFQISLQPAGKPVKTRTIRITKTTDCRILSINCVTDFRITILTDIFSQAIL